jgi:uncharacterized protein (DUF2252 family)
MRKDIPQTIKAFNKGRIPELLRLKYKAMRDDKYRFFRAIPHLFYQDIPSDSFLLNSPHIWLSGDLHLENLGSYKGDNRVTHFSINDFDECILGPCLLDVSRMLTSIYMASATLEIDAKEAHSLSEVFVDIYFEMLQLGYIRSLEKETAKGVIKHFLEKVQKRPRKVLIKKRTVKKKGKLKLLIDNVHSLPASDAEKKHVIKHINIWAKGQKNKGFYEVIDVAFRIAGTSSLGLERYVALVEGRGGIGGHFLLDLKETLPSCARHTIKVHQPKWKTEAERLVEVQKRVLSNPPALLASINIGSKNFVLKELQPTADRVDYALFHGNKKKLKSVIESMASICAWSALRSSGRQNSAIADELIEFAKTRKELKKKVIDYAYNYSKVIDTYHKEYCKAYDKKFFKV